MTFTHNHLGSRQLLAGSLVTLALVAPLSACGSSSTSSSSASTAQSTTTQSTSTSTPTASATDSSSTQMSPTDSSSATDTSSSTDTSSATGTSSATDSSSTPTAVESSTPSAPTSGKAGAFAARKDAKVVAKLVPISALTMKTVVFPKTLGAMTVLGPVNEGTANRYIGYAYPNGSDPVTATATLNGGPGDVDEQVDSFFEKVNSYDGGRYKCGHDTMGSSYSCVARIAGSGQITISTTGVSTNEQMAKYMAEFLDWQK